MCRITFLEYETKQEDGLIQTMPLKKSPAQLPNFSPKPFEHGSDTMKLSIILHVRAVNNLM
jgi:hypothetical protein